uniref:Golgin subfamily A member 5 n=1 Tax=Dicentrarchus labrax TaxID=13489 RepID=A0A8C4EQA9_DICLA
MSWFTDLAGKAEDFLNKVDQGAATALTKNQTRTSSFSSYEEESTVKPEYNTAGYKTDAAVTHHAYASSLHPPDEAQSFISAAAGNIKRSSATLLAGTANVASIPSGSGGSAPSAAKTSSGFVRRKKSEQDVDDDMLFDFLNSSDPPVSNRRDSRREHMKVSVPVTEAQTPEPPPSTTPHTIPSESSSLRLENQLLRSEVASLNQEMASVIQRAKDLQDELNQTRLRADRWNSEQSQTDRMLRELRSQVDDLTEALSAKDGQLAVLKIRLDEADQLLKSRSAALDEAQKEKSRIMQDHTEGSSMHSQALETIQERLREAETALRREQDSYRQMQSEYAGRLSKLEAERQTLAGTVTAAERRGGEEKVKVDDLQQQLKSAKAAAEAAKQELQDYKHKASRILQSKEKLISSLKEGSGLDTLDGSGAMVLELEDLRHEKEMQREDIQKLQGQVQTLRTEIQDLENSAMTEAETWREQQIQLEEQQALLNRAKQEMEAEVERYKQELQYLEEEQHRSKTTLQSRIKDREDEIQKLRNQLTNKTLSNSQTELENRLHQLTETLIQKQTMLEALGTEKSSLVFQLERLEQQLKNAQGGQSGGPAINMSGLEGPGARQRNTPILFSDQDSPGVYGKVRKAASTIDRFSIRLGIFLRRYPMARVFVILYMAVLHLWVMIVLLTYTPEMHHGHPDGR